MTRVGLAGYGMAGADIHAPLLRTAGLEVVAISTRNEERRARASADFPGVVLVDDLTAMLDRSDVDLVVLATPSGQHREQALQTVRAGVACVVDKPLAVTADDAHVVVVAAVREGVPLTVFQNRRYDPPFATTREVVRDGRLGEVYRAEFRWERWRPVPKDRWRENAPASGGGGIMLDLFSHLVDGAVQLFGEVASVYAHVAAHTTSAEDDAFMVCTHASGVISHIGATSVSAAPGPRVRILGSRAAYVQDQLDFEAGSVAELADADADHAGWLYRGAEREAVPVVRSHQADFYRGVAAAMVSEAPQDRMPVDPRDAVHTLAVIDAARLSAQGRTVVEVVTPGQRPD